MHVSQQLRAIRATRGRDAEIDRSAPRTQPIGSEQGPDPELIGPRDVFHVKHIGGASGRVTIGGRACCKNATYPVIVSRPLRPRRPAVPGSRQPPPPATAAGSRRAGRAARRPRGIPGHHSRCRRGNRAAPGSPDRQANRANVAPGPRTDDDLARSRKSGRAPLRWRIFATAWAIHDARHERP